MTLFEEIKQAGIPYDHHESDLYVKCTKEIVGILNKYPLHKKNATTFKCATGHPNAGEFWIDIPFAYLEEGKDTMDIVSIKYTIVNPIDMTESLVFINRDKNGNTKVCFPSPVMIDNQQLAEIGALFTRLAATSDYDDDSIGELLEGYGL